MMTKRPQDTVDWKLATWDGAKREALRRWAALPLERVISALEEMQELDDKLRSSDVAGAIEEQQAGYDAGTENDRD